MNSVVESAYAHAYKCPTVVAGTAVPAKAQKPKIKAELKRQRAHLLEGRGTGTGADYLPYILVERVGFQSHGRSHVVFNEATGRQHHLLSDLELLIFIWIWSLNPVDCFEQFPLERYEYDPKFLFLKPKPRGTVEIAQTLGIKHPQITKLDPRVMTTDFLVKFVDGSYLSIHAKYLKEIEEGPERAHQLRKIERLYWRDRKVHHLVMNETPFTTLLATRMMWAIDGMKWIREGIDVNCILDSLESTSTGVPMGERLEICSRQLGLSKTTVVIGFKYAVLTRLWTLKNPHQDYNLSLSWPGARSRARKATSAMSLRMPSL